MSDPIFESFLEAQQREALELASSSDLLDVHPLDGPTARHYLAVFGCAGLVRSSAGEVTTANRFVVGIFLPPDYLRRAEPAEVLTWLSPAEIWHPNVDGRRGLVCPGPLAPGTRLHDLLFQLFEIVTWHRATLHEANALCWDACRWARAQDPGRFPVDRRPLRRLRARRTAEGANA